MNEISIPTADGLTIYFVVKELSNGQFYNAATQGFEAFNAAHWANYAIALTKTTLAANVQASYLGNFPTAITTVGMYECDSYIQAGGSPAVGDGVPQWETVGYWNGSQMFSDATSAIVAGMFTGVAVLANTPIDATGRMTVVQGDDYAAADGLALTWTQTYSGPSVSGATLTLRVKSLANVQAGLAGTVFVATGSASVSGGVLTATVTLTAAQTALLVPTPPQGNNAWQYQLLLTYSSGRVHTLVEGPLNALPQMV